ncbi:MAG: hypothetical protein Q8M94_10035, partial [Ignavibacteria bacterium]|nr:hypothetical protein [Ignavibacteria bacterium]
RCSNLKKNLYYPDEKITSLGWDNERGEIRAFQEHLNFQWDETKKFEGLNKEWFIFHEPWGGGLTILKRI